MTTQVVDRKIVERIRKLLNLARDGGATEAEAALAMDRAQEIMEAHSLSIATVEAGGGTGEARSKQQSRGRAANKWMTGIMDALAESYFVFSETVEPRREGYNDERRKPGGYVLIGRESAVVQVQLMHEYLVSTVHRVARARGTPTDELFKLAMGTRIAERLKERHADSLRQQREEAERKNREQAARATHPGASSSSTALAVILEDYEQMERDANEDLRWGREPGTTARQRREREARVAARQAEEDRLAALHGRDVAYWVAYVGKSLEEAQEIVSRAAQPKLPPEPETDRQRARRIKEEFDSTERMWRRFQKERDRENSPSYRAGRDAGNRVGLDTQVGQRETRKLS